MRLFFKKSGLLLRRVFRRKQKDDTSKLLSVIKAVEELEEAGHLLVVSDGERKGIVVDYTLSNYLNMCYVTRMQYYTKMYTLDGFLKARHTRAKFSRKHNPDEELVNLCANARLVIAFREAGRGNTEQKPYPLFITFMDEKNKAAMSVGYEVGGIVNMESADAK